ncbi:MAG: DUF2782 domain-containing protein [Pseudomonadales bacterium]|nr:DUF2782 domain-containing protein [Pseudomonadales bacterium]
MRHLTAQHPRPRLIRHAHRISGRRLPGFALLSACLLFPAAGWSAESVDIRGPDVTIIAEEERTVFEYRQGGVLRMVRVVPNWGKPYYLVPRDQTTGETDLERAETLIPSWVIVEF